MAKITIEKWICDRCGSVHDKRPPMEGVRHNVRVSVDYGTAGGIIIDWREMCPDCDRAVERIIDALKTPKPETAAEPPARSGEGADHG